MLEWKNLCFSYGTKEVLRDLSDRIADGEILAVMGPSGCGKSTLLALSAGLLKPTSGEILSTASKPSVVFQEPRLLPWYSVLENLRAVLPGHTADAQIADALELVELRGCELLSPSALSGGMKSRVAIARAIAYGGDLFLLDEPFAALDGELRHRIGTRMHAYLKEKNRAALLVTHHPSDAEKLADRTMYLPLLEANALT